MSHFRFAKLSRDGGAYVDWASQKLPKDGCVYAWWVSQKT